MPIREIRASNRFLPIPRHPLLVGRILLSTHRQHQVLVLLRIEQLLGFLRSHLPGGVSRVLILAFVLFFGAGLLFGLFLLR